MKKICFAFVSVSLLAACSGNLKKMVIMSKGPVEVNTDAKTIKAVDGSGHDEKEVTAGGSDVSFKLSAPAGEATVQLTEPGLYIVNAKTDTIIGGYIKYGDAKNANNVISQETLKKQLDSLQLLVEGKNISKANRNFYILPNGSVKISDNVDAMVIGPYHRMRSAEKTGDKDPEIYRFYSIKDLRETIAKLEVLTTPVKQ